MPKNYNCSDSKPTHNFILVFVGILVLFCVLRILSRAHPKEPFTNKSLFQHNTDLTNNYELHNADSTNNDAILQKY